MIYIRAFLLHKQRPKTSALKKAWSYSETMHMSKSGIYN
ncbi:Ltp family lipoprotein [Collinsella tanakaei]